MVDTPDPAALAPFWEAASGWAAGTSDDGVGLRHPDGTGPWLELLPTDDPKVVKNRVHLDVAPYAADDQAAEVERLKALGATDVDVGPGRARRGWCWPTHRAASSASSALAIDESRPRSTDEFIVLNPRSA